MLEVAVADPDPVMLEELEELGVVELDHSLLQPPVPLGLQIQEVVVVAHKGELRVAAVLV